MAQVKKSHLLIALSSLFCLIGCKTDVDISHYIDRKIPLVLTIVTKDTSNRFSSQNKFEIPVNSSEYLHLIDWGNKNVHGWTESFASFAANAYISQENFRLLILANETGVVVGFADGNNKAKQYVKTIKKGELDFLKK